MTATSDSLYQSCSIPWYTCIRGKLGHNREREGGIKVCTFYIYKEKPTIKKGVTWVKATLDRGQIVG